MMPTASQLEEHRLLIPGLLIQPEPKRFYPDSAIAAHLAGDIGEVTETERAQRRFAAVRSAGKRDGDCGAAAGCVADLEGAAVRRGDARAGRQPETRAGNVLAQPRHRHAFLARLIVARAC